MSYKVVVLHQAELDLQELKYYIVKNFSPATWKTSYTRLKKAINKLKTFPFTGNLPPELEYLNLSQYRQIVVGMNRIIYEVRKETVYIHIVSDARKELKNLLTKRLLRI